MRDSYTLVRMNKTSNQVPLMTGFVRVNRDKTSNCIRPVYFFIFHMYLIPFIPVYLFSNHLCETLNSIFTQIYSTECCVMSHLSPIQPTKRRWCKDLVPAHPHIWLPLKFLNENIFENLRQCLEVIRTSSVVMGSHQICFTNLVMWIQKSPTFDSQKVGRYNRLHNH